MNEDTWITTAAMRPPNDQIRKWLETDDNFLDCFVALRAPRNDTESIIANEVKRSRKPDIFTLNDLISV